MSSTSSTTRARGQAGSRARKGPGRGKSENPVNRLVAWVWRMERWIESTFALGMLELWEKLLVCFVVFSLSSLIWWSVYFHFPNHIRSVLERSTYYIFGTSSNSSKEAIQEAVKKVVGTAKASQPSYGAVYDDL